MLAVIKRKKKRKEDREKRRVLLQALLWLKRLAWMIK